MVWPFGPPLGKLRDEWDRTPVESIAKIHETKKEGRKQNFLQRRRCER
jgi:hypothetical protein